MTKATKTFVCAQNRRRREDGLSSSAAPRQIPAPTRSGQLAGMWAIDGGLGQCRGWLMGVVLGFLVALPHLEAELRHTSWKLEYATRIPLRDRAGKIVGSTKIAAGTVVELLPSNSHNTNRNTLRLRHLGEEFEMPVGADLAALVKKQNVPDNSPPNQKIVDLHAVKLEEIEKANEARDATQAARCGVNPQTTAGPPLPPTFVTEAIPMAVAPEALTEVPEGFAWDRTLIIPGKFAFLKLPFIKQTKPGVCVAAASINAVCYLHPDIRLSGSELFRLYCDRKSGSSFQEAAVGNLQLGVRCRSVWIGGSSYQRAVEMVQRSIEANLPVVAADARHAVLIYGFNKEKRKLFVWNQWGNGKVVDGMPKGTYLLQESDLPLEFRDLMFVEKVRFAPVETFRKEMEAKVGEAEDLQVHPVALLPFGSLDGYLGYSTPQRIKACLRAGRTVLIPQGKNLVCVLPNEIKKDSEPLSCRELPFGITARHTLQSVTDLIAHAKGEFYSVKSAARLEGYLTPPKTAEEATAPSVPPGGSRESPPTPGRDS